MAVVCADCSTENRDAARFCKSCGAKLNASPAPSRAPVPPADTGWPTTAPAPLARMPELPVGLFDPSVPAPAPHMPARAALPPEEATVIVGAGAPSKPLVTAAASGAPATPTSATSGAPAKPRPAPAPAQPFVPRKPPAPVGKAPAATPTSSGRGIRIGIVAFALLVGIGGWYVLRDGNGSNAPAASEAAPTAAAAAPAPAPAAPVAASDPAAAASSATPDPAPAPATVPTSAPAPTPLSEPASVAPASAFAAPPPAAATSAPARATPVTAAAPARSPVVAATPKPRKVPVAGPSATATEAAAPTVPAPPPVAPPPANPQTACAGRNFVALAQCMAAQCTKAEFKASVQCDAVRTQQRLEEEKRNPSLLN